VAKSYKAGKATVRDSIHEFNSGPAAFAVLEVQSERIGSILPREAPGLKPMGTVMLRSSEFDGKM